LIALDPKTKGVSIEPAPARHRPARISTADHEELRPLKYIFLIYETPRDLEAREQPGVTPYVAAWRAYHQALLESGAYVGGAPLKSVATATTVRAKDAQRHVQDGPYSEAKEQLGGFMILDLPSLDAALSWAARCPAASTGAVEVRPMDVGMHETICGS
jgi:hypothetical protein